MAYIITSPAVLSFTIEGRQEGQQVMSIFHYLFNNPSFTSDGRAQLEAFADRMHAVGGLYDLYRNCLSEEVVQLRTRTQWIAPTRFAFVERTPAFTTGGVTGTAFPSNTAVDVTRRTQNSGRTQRGTIHMPGVPATFLASGSVTTAGNDAYSTFAALSLSAIVTAFEAGNFFPCLFHRSAPTVVQQLINFRVQPTARVMRRRTVGLGK